MTSCPGAKGCLALGAPLLADFETRVIGVGRRRPRMTFRVLVKTVEAVTNKRLAQPPNLPLVRSERCTVSYQCCVRHNQASEQDPGHTGAKGVKRWRKRNGKAGFAASDRFILVIALIAQVLGRGPGVGRSRAGSGPASPIDACTRSLHTWQRAGLPAYISRDPWMPAIVLDLEDIFFPPLFVLLTGYEPSR